MLTSVTVRQSWTESNSSRSSGVFVQLSQLPGASDESPTCKAAVDVVVTLVNCLIQDRLSKTNTNVFFHSANGFEIKARFLKNFDLSQLMDNIKFGSSSRSEAVNSANGLPLIASSVILKSTVLGYKKTNKCNTLRFNVNK